MSDPLAYLITFRCYGTWLHGDERSSIDRAWSGPDAALRSFNPELQGYEQASMKHPRASLDARRRRAVEDTIAATCTTRHWKLLAINVRTEHVHVVVATGLRPETVMNSLKSWCTRRLREQGLARGNERIWSRHGSTRHLWSDTEVATACEYVVEGQGRGDLSQR